MANKTCFLGSYVGGRYPFVNRDETSSGGGAVTGLGRRVIM